jgi:perosamine synthetase
MTIIESEPVPFARPLIAEGAGAAVDRVLRSGWVTTGPECAAFEREFAAYLGVSHAITVSSCTAALELALRGLRLRRGARVLTPAMTFCGAVQAIVHAGCQPVLADCDPETGEVSPRTAHAAAATTGGVDAMVVLHYAGRPAPVDELAAAVGLPLDRVVEDAAHGLGTFVAGSDGDRPVGGSTRASCFSFYATKNLPIGEGGMLTTEDDELAARVRTARLHGMTSDAWRRYLPGGSWRYSVEETGLKANLSDVQAAIGRVQLRHLDGWQVRRREIAERYTAGLAGVAGLALPSAPARGRHAWHLYVVRVQPGFGRTRDELSACLTAQGIGTSVHFIPVHHMRHFRRVCVGPPGGLPGTDAVFDEVLSLPMYPGLSDSDIDRVVDAVGAARATGATHRYEEVLP